jgi:hypothetical protein
MNEPKFNKTDVSYSLGKAAEHCGKVFKDDHGHCDNFVGSRQSLSSPGACKKVKGSIERTYWCTQWKSWKG